jgi:hypothetical protein
MSLAVFIMLAMDGHAEWRSSSLVSCSVPFLALAHRAIVFLIFAQPDLDHITRKSYQRDPISA